MPAAPPEKRRLVAATDVPPNYKRIVLSNTTIGMLLATTPLRLEPTAHDGGRQPDRMVRR